MLGCPVPRRLEGAQLCVRARRCSVLHHTRRQAQPARTPCPARPCLRAQEGTGIVKLVPHVSPECVDLIVKLLAYNPDDRLRCAPD